MIRSGELAPGDRLPSESQLIEEFGVARMTVRQALGVLRIEGLAEARHGSGVFVTEVGAPDLSRVPTEQLIAEIIRRLDLPSRGATKGSGTDRA